MKKNYILDTNILLQDATSIFQFEDNNIIIPVGVIEELDKFKKENNELGRNARQVSRYLDDLRVKGDLQKGVPVKEGSLRICYNGNLDSYLKVVNVDFHVIRIAQYTMEQEPNIPCIIISRDINVRIKANALGIKAENYKGNALEPSYELDKGFDVMSVPLSVMRDIEEKGKLPIEEFKNLKNKNPNYYYLLECKTKGNEVSLLAKVDKLGENIIMLNASGCQRLMIKPRNLEQTFALDALLDPDIKLVSLSGVAGTGKTLLAVASGYYMTEEKRMYKRMLVSRPVIPMGKDLGYLPGDLNEKLDPWMQPIYDAFDVIQYGKKNGNGKNFVNMSENIIVEPLTYIRGRSIQDQYMIVDESQNLTPLEIKTIITRASENTKIVLTGDVEQIDNPYVDTTSNGLSVVMDAFSDSSIASGIVLSKGVRSKLSEEACKRL
jgi:PhoH-like ATPase